LIYTTDSFGIRSVALDSFGVPLTKDELGTTSDPAAVPTVAPPLAENPTDTVEDSTVSDSVPEQFAKSEPTADEVSAPEDTTFAEDEAPEESTAEDSTVVGPEDEEDAFEAPPVAAKRVLSGDKPASEAKEAPIP